MEGVVFLGPARVLLQERETTAEGVRVNGVVWIVRCIVQHLRSLSESEKRLCSIAEQSHSGDSLQCDGQLGTCRSESVDVAS